MKLTINQYIIEYNITRSLTVEDKQYVRNALNDLRDSFPSGCSVFGAPSCHGFSDEVIDCITNNSHRIFTLNDVNTYLPVFTLYHGLKILKILDELFNDIPHIDPLSCLFNNVLSINEEPEQDSDSDEQSNICELDSLSEDEFNVE